MCKVAVIIPTRNGGETFQNMITALNRQTYPISYKIVVDSSSEDDTPIAAQNAGFTVQSIAPETFDHGGTRQMALNFASGVDIVIYLTQDSVLATPDAIETLIDCFNDASVGAAYGRQLPTADAEPHAVHARFFNYPPVSCVKSLGDAETMGIKTVFLSNSFAAYRYSALNGVGGFPQKIDYCEDMYVAAKLVLGGWQIAYCSAAQVFHSHNYSLGQEFQRYVRIGAFHARNRWIGANFGKTGGEGVRFALSEIRFLYKNQEFSAIFSSILRSCLKYMAYKWGFLTTEKNLSPK